MAYYRLDKPQNMTDTEINRLLVELGSDVGIRLEKTATKEIFVWMAQGSFVPFPITGGPFADNVTARADLGTETGWFS